MPILTSTGASGGAKPPRGMHVQHLAKPASGRGNRSDGIHAVVAAPVLVRIAGGHLAENPPNRGSVAARWPHKCCHAHDRDMLLLYTLKRLDYEVENAFMWRAIWPV